MTINLYFSIESLLNKIKIKLSKNTALITLQYILCLNHLNYNTIIIEYHDKYGVLPLLIYE